MGASFDVARLYDGKDRAYVVFLRAVHHRLSEMHRTAQGANANG